MKRYIVERDIPGVGERTVSEMRSIAQTSNDALAKLAPRIQWQESFITGEKTFCVYLAEDEAVIRKHGEISGIPVTRITEVRRVTDPTAALRKG